MGRKSPEVQTDLARAVSGSSDQAGISAVVKLVFDIGHSPRARRHATVARMRSLSPATSRENDRTSRFLASASWRRPASYYLGTATKRAPVSLPSSLRSGA